MCGPKVEKKHIINLGNAPDGFSLCAVLMHLARTWSPPNGCAALPKNALHKADASHIPVVNGRYYRA